MQEKKNKIKTLGLTLLRQWLKQEKSTLYWLSKEIDIAHITLFKIMHATNHPSLHTAVKIEEATGGYVPCRSWITNADTKLLEKRKKKTNTKTGTNNKKKGNESS